MEFDFYTRYLSLGEEDLFYILNNPEKHQPKAVESARQVLQERGIGEDDFKAYKKKTTAAFVDERAQDYGEYDIFNSIEGSDLINPKMDKYHKRIMALSVFQGIFAYFGIIMAIRNMIIFDYCTVESLFGIMYRFAFFPLLIYFLYKKKPWGWILFVFNLILPIPSYLRSIYGTLSRGMYDDWNIGFLVGQLVTYILLFLLLRFMCFRYVHQYYGISVARRKQVLKYSVLILLAIEFLSYLFRQLYP
ncbi:hypothetical protein DBR32_08600 [Taibaiella sp. KBW10]|uniref:hypothetical protein n=1 Tax=Taibaiella sp. KBW10 TaxID=2153357 RepID=UPI000F5AFA80|nr:hypothetical protein [Taibaiella sp. KBW10]RQO30774.1 hypothetical protein DBR32_08600 [Taibaiella sp. KBW10]